MFETHYIILFGPFAMIPYEFEIIIVKPFMAIESGLHLQNKHKMETDVCFLHKRS